MGLPLVQPEGSYVWSPISGVQDAASTNLSCISIGNQP